MSLQALEELSEYLGEKADGLMLSRHIDRAELTVYTTPEKLSSLLQFLRDDGNCLFRQLTDICGADYPERPERFEVIYHLLSLKQNLRIRVKVTVAEAKPVVPSIMELYPSAGWYEREVWDMYGVFFSGNADLRRILTDYGFDGHPLRKDFPLTGYVEMRYDEEQKRVVYEPVKLTQDFRRFDYLSPWEGASYVLPGDEKAKA
jgi:NADH-quinone oxidoreductase subunit C